LLQVIQDLSCFRRRLGNIGWVPPLQTLKIKKFLADFTINAEFHADFKSVEKVLKNAHKKSYKQNKFEEYE
jgi:hypothetical protein